MPYYQKISGANKSLNLYALDSTKFPSSGGDYDCSTSTAEPYHTATGFYSGTTQIYCNYAGQYTLTASVTDFSYLGSHQVSRTSSPERGASTGSVMYRPMSGATAAIYKGDVLTISATGSTYYGAYNFSSLNAPSCSATASDTVVVTNPSSNPVACDVYRGSTLIKSSLAAGSSYTDTGLSGSTQYSYTLKATPTRTKYVCSGRAWFNNDTSATTITVADNVTAHFMTQVTSTSTESGSVVTSSATSVTTPAAASWHTVWTGSTTYAAGIKTGTLTASATLKTSYKYRITATCSGNTNTSAVGTGSADLSWSGSGRFGDWTATITVTPTNNSTTLNISKTGTHEAGTSAIPAVTLTKVEAYY